MHKILSGFEPTTSPVNLCQSLHQCATNRLRGYIYKISHDIRFITSNSVRSYVSSVFRKPLIHVFQAARFEIELFTYFADESEAIFHPMISTKNLNEHVIYNEANVKSPQGNKL